MNRTTYWLILTFFGLTANGTGLCLFGDAVLHKTVQPDYFDGWFWEGILALILIQAGICCLIEAAVSRLRPPH